MESIYNIFFAKYRFIFIITFFQTNFNFKRIFFKAFIYVKSNFLYN